MKTRLKEPHFFIFCMIVSFIGTVVMIFILDQIEKTYPMPFAMRLLALCSGNFALCFAIGRRSTKWSWLREEVEAGKWYNPNARDHAIVSNQRTASICTLMNQCILLVLLILLPFGPHTLLILFALHVGLRNEPVGVRAWWNRLQHFDSAYPY